jgi:hypothetical protein
MKFFPKNRYAIELLNDKESALSNLKNNTLSKEQFVANYNKQVFIGWIDENEFELQLSKKLYGACCVLRGKIENKTGTVEIRISLTFKIIFLAIALFAFSGIIAAMIQNKTEAIAPLVIAILLTRFVFIQFIFYRVSKRAQQKLTALIGIKKWQSIE